MTATLETHPDVTAPSTVGRLEAGCIGAAVATIPVFLVAILIAVQTPDGVGILSDGSLSSRAANVVLYTAPLLLTAAMGAVSLAAKPLGLRTGATAAVRLTSAAIALVVAATIPLPLLATPSAAATAFLMLGMSPVVAGFVVLAEPAISAGLLASVVLVGLSVAASLATTQRRIQEREFVATGSDAGTLLLLPCLLPPLLLLSMGYLPVGSTRLVLWAIVLAAPALSLWLFGSAFVAARSSRSRSSFSRLRLAGRCMFFCAVELSCLATLLGQTSIC